MTKVIIVGAGISALIAAKKILSESDCQVTIIEATDKVGGRINNIRFGSKAIPTALGAAYLHGSKEGAGEWGEKYSENPLVPLLKQASVKPAPIDENALTVFNENGEELGWFNKLRYIVPADNKQKKLLDAAKTKAYEIYNQRILSRMDEIKEINQALDAEYTAASSANMSHEDRRKALANLHEKRMAALTEYPLMTCKMPTIDEVLPQLIEKEDIWVKKFIAAEVTCR